MKRYICLIISLCLILGSFSFSFAAVADWTTTDQQNLSNAASYLNTIKNYFSSTGTVYSLMQTMNSTLSNINNKLTSGNQSIASIVDDISSWMSPIYNSITSIPSDLSSIIGALGYTKDGTYHPYLNDLYSVLSNKFYSESLISRPNSRQFIHSQLLNATNGLSSDGTYYIPTVQDLGSYQNYTVNWTYGSPLGNLALLLQKNTQNDTLIYRYRWAADLTGYNSQQTALNWGNLGNSYFIPSSSTDGIYKWLAAIQAPVARLSYVLASDERITAQQAAAAAEQEVVDDFIDPAGDSSATASDFGSISDLSSGYQQNFGSTASVSGIFDIFDSNNFGWFSSETYQQLDTTVAQRGSSFETPLLDQQLEDISRALGVDYAN